MIGSEALLRGFAEQASRLWLGALAITLSVAFVVTGTMVASSVREDLVQDSIERPLATTGVLTADEGRVPSAAGELGLPVTDLGVTVFAAAGQAPLAGERAVLPADDAFVQVTEGGLPEKDGEVAVDDRTARILAARPGDTVYLASVDGAIEPWLLTGVVSVKTGGPRTYVAIAVTGAGMQSLLGRGYDAVLLTGDPAGHAEQLLGLGLGDGLQLRDVSAEMARTISRTNAGLSVVGVLLSSLTLVTAVAGAFVIGNTFAVAAAGRRREAALLRLIGASRAQIRNQFLGEALMLGATASALGVVIGAAIGYVVTMAMGTPVAPGLGIAIGGIVVGLLVTVVGLWGPVRRIGEVSPVEALGAAERTELERPAKVRWLVVLPGLLVGALVLQIPIAGAVFGGLIAFVVLVVLGPLLVPKLGRMVMAGPWRRGPVAAMARANVTRYPRRSARSTTAVLMGVALAASTTALVTAMTKVADLDNRGDVIVYAPAAGKQLQRELAELPGVGAVTPKGDSELLVYTSTTPQQFEASASGVLQRWPGSHVGDAEGSFTDTREMLAVLTLALGSVAGMSLVVGLVGVGNTVRLTTRERAREFAVLRAVGMTRRQLASMVVVESAGLTSVGALLGLLLAGATIYGMLGAASIILLPLISWWLIGLIVVALVAVGAAMALGPARTAARVEPARAVAATGG